MEPQKLEINFFELLQALQDNSGRNEHYLDRETGHVIFITEDVRGAIDTLKEDQVELDEQYAETLKKYDIPEWMYTMVYDAYLVEDDEHNRYQAIPPGDSRVAYRTMEDFIETVTDRRLANRLELAIQGRGAFRRFKDTLLDYPAERQRWFAFEEVRQREQVLEWLREQEIDAVLK